MFMRITLHFEIFFPAFCTILPCVLHQNALQLAPKRTAFSGILHCILLQMAQNLARTVTALNKNSFWRIHIYPPFRIKTNLRENRFFATSRAIGAQKGHS